jgi:glycosyltransferase involved in cell wall biosynthesis
MKIGFFGNTNNYPFMLAQALRELGHEVLFVITSQELLNRPESRYPDLKEHYPDWIVDAAHLSEWDMITLSPKLAPVLEVLSNCETLVLNFTGPSLWPLLQRPAIALLTGSDLEHYANFATIEVRSGSWDPAYRASAEAQMNLNLLREFVQRQRDGIREALAVRYMPRGLVPAGDAMLDELGVPDEKRVFLPSAELELVIPTPARHNNPVRIFCATRLTWKLPIEPGRSLLDYKGSDIMIRGLGLFYRQTGVRLDIHLVRKGLHVAETEQLVVEEDLTDQVTWSDEMSLTEVWTEFARSDIVIEQLANGAIGGAGLDAMAAGRPVIGNARREMFEDYFGQHSPICQAQTAEEVCAQLKRLVSNPAKREKIGELGRRFVEEHCSPRRAAQICLERLQPVCAADRFLTHQTITGHRYYLQRSYDDREALLSLQQASKDTQAELEAKNHTLQTAQADLQTTRAELHTTQQTLQNTQAELKAMKHTAQTTEADLHTTQQTLQNTQVELLAKKHTLQTTEADLHTTQQTLQNTQVELLATQVNLARYQDFLPIRVLRKLRRLVKSEK